MNPHGSNGANVKIITTPAQTDCTIEAEYFTALLPAHFAPFVLTVIQEMINNATSGTALIKTACSKQFPKAFCLSSQTTNVDELQNLGEKDICI